MITNDLTQGHPNRLQFYMNQYVNTSTQIQLIMDKQNDLIKLVRELNDYQFLLVSRQTELLNSINQLSNQESNPIQPVPETINQVNTPTHLPTANQRPISETINNNTRRYYPNLYTPLTSPRPTHNNITRVTDTTPQTTTQTTPQTTTQTTPQTTPQNAYDNYLIYTLFSEGRNRSATRSATRTPQRETSSLTATLLDTFLDEFLNPVSTAATNDEIQNGTTSLVYDEIENPVNTSCPISLNTFQEDDTILQINRCRHNYNPASLLEWFTSNTHCPLCRIDIRDIE